MDSHLQHTLTYEDENGKLPRNGCHMKFQQSSQNREHIFETRSTTLQLLELPIECLMKILRYLAPNQLITASQVCRKLKDLVEKVFELYCDPGPIQIKYGLAYNSIPDSLRRFESRPLYKVIFDYLWIRRLKSKIPRRHKSGDEYDFVYKSQYEKVFPSLIRRLTIPRPHVNGKGYKRAFKFIRKNCSENLISLFFSDNRSPQLGDEFKFNRRIYGEIAKDQLKNLKHLRVKDVSFEYLWDELLQYTEHLQTLNVIHHCCYSCRHNDSQFCSHFDDAWTNHTYPELKSICVHTSDDRFDLMPMIKRHPKLRNVACNSPATIRSMFQSNIKFNYTAMLFSCHARIGLSRLDEFHEEIVEFGRSKRFEKFELGLQGLCKWETHRIDEIPNLTGLHPSFTIIYDSAYSTRLPIIERLCFMNFSSPREVKELTQKINWIFPNLKELRINAHNQRFLRYRYESGFKQYALGILYDSRKFKNLERFHYENDEDVEFAWDEVVAINLIRSKRPDPSKITVYLDPEHFHRFNKNVVELPFIEIKPWVHGGCQICPHFDRHR